MPIDALSVLCAQLTRDLLAIAKFLLHIKRDGNIPTGASNARGYQKSWFSTNISLYLGNDARWSHSYYVRRIGNRTQASKFQGHDIIQCQITRKRYNIELYLQLPTNRKSYMIYRSASFSMTLNDPYSRFQGHTIDTERGCCWMWVLLCFSVSLCSLFSNWLMCMQWLATNLRGLFKRLLSRGGRLSPFA